MADKYGMKLVNKSLPTQGIQCDISYYLFKIFFRRRAANKALKSRPGMSRSLSNLSAQHLPPAPNVPPPKIPTAPHKGEEYVGLNGDHVTYKSPPGSAYTTLDSKSNLLGVKVLPEHLHVKV